MPRLPVASGRDIVAALQHLGFGQTRQRGSHVVMRRGPFGCTVPLHREMKKGTLATILRQADLTVEDLMAALDR